MSDFTLRDLGGMLDDEHFTHLGQAVDRTTFVLWAGRPWQIHPDAPIPPGRTVVVSAEDRAEVDSDDQPCPECGLGQTTPHSQHGQPDDDGDDQIGSVTA